METNETPNYTVPPIMQDETDTRKPPPLADTMVPSKGLPSFMTDDKRVVLSLTLRQVEDLVRCVDSVCNYYETNRKNLPDPFATWSNRLARIYDHMIDNVDIHFTNLA